MDNESKESSNSKIKNEHPVLNINERDRAATTALLEMSGIKKSSKNLYMGIYYVMIILALLVISIGISVAMTRGLAGQLHFSQGLLYFGMTIALLILALYFKTKAQY